MKDQVAEYMRRLEEDRLRRAIRKQIKPRPEPRTGSRGRWQDSGEEETDAPAVERVMPPGERERRRANASAVQTTWAQPGAEPEHADPREPLSEDREAAGPATERGAGTERGVFTERGVVTEVSQGLCRVQVGADLLLCGIRGSLTAVSTGYVNVVAVGDEVRVIRDGAGGGIVDEVLPRRSILARPDVGGSNLTQVIVANAGQLLAVAAWRDPAIWLELVDRHLITAARFGLAPLICVNKTDLAVDADLCRRTMAPYETLGYRVLFTSAATGEGVGELRAALQGETTVLAGLSGVGKSSLLSAVQPGLRLRTGAIAAYHIGRHTTTQVRMFALEGGGYVVDTPGIRGFGLVGLTKGELASFYPEIAAVAAGCRFRDCLHTGEEDCALPAALSGGAVSATRYKNYLKILDSLPD